VQAVPELKNIRDLERELYRGQGISWDCIDKNETKWVQVQMRGAGRERACCVPALRGV
jgi:hypothetical protein